MKKNIIYLALTAVILIVLLVPGIREKLSRQFFPVATIENAVTLSESDYDVALKGLNVPSTNLKNFRGNRTVFLNFWGTWCAPCRREWPSIQKLYDSKNKEVDFVLIAMQDKEEDVRKFMKENGYTVPVYIAQSPLSSAILPKAFPTTFLLDKNGRILIKEDATRDWNSPSVHQMIEAVAR